MRETDTLDTKGILRLIESVPSPKAEPFKLWLAQMGRERIDEVFDPEIAIKRAIDYYRNRGYSDKWIEARLKGILDRNKLTDVWKENGIKESYEFTILTNEIYQTWSGMKASEYKEYENIRKESLRDNMTDVEVALTDLGEIATRELAKKHRPQGLKANKKIAKEGGEVAKTARDDLEKKYITFMEDIHGNLSKTIKGLDREEKWSDLWYIFKPNGFDKTLAEMDSNERENRRKIDGSVQAFQEFAKWYEKN